MRYSHIVQWDYRTVAVVVFLALVPNLLGMVNLTTPFGFKLHFFQLAVFLAALLYGPWAGLLSGAVGSVYSAAMMHNPYIVVGNAVLGFMVGLLVSRGVGAVRAVFFAFLVQLPWLIVTDIHLMHLPVQFVAMLVIALAGSNLVWALVARHTAPWLSRLL